MNLHQEVSGESAVQRSRAGHDPLHAVRHDPEVREVISLVSAARHVPKWRMLRRCRGKADTAMARHIAMYLAHTFLSRTLSEVAALFGRDRTTVSYACAKIEDLRERRRFDEELCALEDATPRPVPPIWDRTEPGAGHGN